MQDSRLRWLCLNLCPDSKFDIEHTHVYILVICVLLCIWMRSCVMGKWWINYVDWTRGSLLRSVNNCMNDRKRVLTKMWKNAHLWWKPYSFCYIKQGIDQTDAFQKWKPCYVLRPRELWSERAPQTAVHEGLSVRDRRIFG